MRSHCKKCVSENFSERYKNTLVKASYAERSRKYLLKRYGLTSADYDILLEKQKGVCAVCCNPPNTKNSKKLYVDHDHETGKVRGLLCHSCNTAIGHARESIEMLLKLVDYLKASK